MQSSTGNVLALDVGQKRIGMAFAGDGIKLARSLPTVDNNSQFLSHLSAIVKEHTIDTVVVGLPRNLSGGETPQTKLVRAFAEKLAQQLPCPIVFQDEALSSVHAETILKHTKDGYQKGEVDSLAAQTILTDYLEERK